MWTRFGEEARQAVFHAQEEAVLHISTVVEPEHLLLAFTEMPSSNAMRMLESLAVTCDAIQQKFRPSYPRVSKRPLDMTLSPRTKRVIDLAYETAKTRKESMLGTEHLLLGIVKEKTGPVAEFLIEAGANLARLQEALAELGAN